VPGFLEGKPEIGRDPAFAGGSVAGMSAVDMRAMFFIYVVVIAAGLVGFTLLGLLQR
jgi:hypothetical protein